MTVSEKQKNKRRFAEKRGKISRYFSGDLVDSFCRGQKTQDDGKRDDAKLAIIQSVIYSPMLYGRGGSL